MGLSGTNPNGSLEGKIKKSPGFNTGPGYTNSSPTYGKSGVPKLNKIVKPGPVHSHPAPKAKPSKTKVGPVHAHPAPHPVNSGGSVKRVAPAGPVHSHPSLPPANGSRRVTQTNDAQRVKQPSTRTEATIKPVAPRTQIVHNGSTSGSKGSSSSNTSSSPAATAANNIKKRPTNVVDPEHGVGTVKPGGPPAKMTTVPAPSVPGVSGNNADLLKAIQQLGASLNNEFNRIPINLNEPNDGGATNSTIAKALAAQKTRQAAELAASAANQKKAAAAKAAAPIPKVGNPTVPSPATAAAVAAQQQQMKQQLQQQAGEPPSGSQQTIPKVGQPAPIPGIPNPGLGNSNTVIPNPGAKPFQPAPPIQPAPPVSTGPVTTPINSNLNQPGVGNPNVGIGMGPQPGYGYQPGFSNLPPGMQHPGYGYQRPGQPTQNYIQPQQPNDNRGYLARTSTIGNGYA